MNLVFYLDFAGILFLFFCLEIIIEFGFIKTKRVDIMRAILTVVGKDKVGIVAGVSQKLAELNLNIVDMTQTIMQDYFTMMMILEIEKDTSADFDQIRHELTEVGQSLSVSIHIQNEDIFEAMHKLG